MESKSMYIPVDCKYIIDRFKEIGREAFVVGGCVRDSLLGEKPKDWDITTNSLPQETIDMFKGLGYKVVETGLQHGTVTVLVNHEPYEITTYRIEGKYIDNRKPSEVEYTQSLEADLERRDFTINAMAFNEESGVQDFYKGMEDLNNKIIRAVGNANDRFEEDALRMLRAVRFSSRLGFEIETDTEEAIKIKAPLIQNISKERIREELSKILLSKNASYGIRKLVELGLMKFIIPEMIPCVGFEQKSKYHNQDIFEHTMTVIANTPDDIEIRLASLFHDIGKPTCFTEDERGGHFYGHASVSSEITHNIMKRLKYDNKKIENVVMLVKEHMIDPVGVKKKTLRKILGRIGEENIFKLLHIMEADRLASNPEYAEIEDIASMKKKVIEIISNKEPLRVSDLEVNGKDLMNLGFKPGPQLGDILNELLEICLEDPSKNTRDGLIDIIENRA